VRCGYSSYCASSGGPTEKLSRSAGFALEPDYTSSPAKAKVADTTSAEGAVGCSGLLGRYYRVQTTAALWPATQDWVRLALPPSEDQPS